MTNPLLEAALKYAEMGFSVIPIIPGQKKPLVKWEPFQKVRATRPQIISWWGTTPKANIGIVTGEISDLFVVDIDTEEGQQNLLQYGFDTIVTPTVKTPRGGQHLYFRYPTGKKITIGAGIIPGTDFRGNGGFVVAPPSMNGEGSAYAWGLSLIDNAISSSIPENYLKKICAYNYSTIDLRDTTADSCSTTDTTKDYINYKILQDGRRDDDLFYVANSLARGGRGREFSTQVLEILAKNCNPPFSKAEMELKIKNAFERIEKKERNLMDEVREFILLQNDYITVTSILQMLHLTTKEEKKHLTVIMHRLQEKEIIEKYGNTPGTYRIKNKTVNKVDWAVDDEIKDFKVKLPLELSRMCVLSPGNIIMVAGSKSAGKTALLLNIAFANQHEYEIDYLNSEMHPSEFKKRVKKFGGNLKDCKINAYTVTGNYSDYIVDSGKPKIYFVDFLEVHDNFFEIAKPIRKIHEKLGDSICFIAVHMKMGGLIGRGGDFSAEKARLYLTLDYMANQRCTKITILDAKEPRDENVRGQFRLVKIIDGYRLTPIPGSEGEWHW